MDGISQPRGMDAFDFAPMPAGAMLDATAQRFGNSPAIDFLGRRWTWAEIGALANRAAAGLQKIGVAKGVHVGLCLPNTPYSVVMYYAILKAGGTVVNFNPLYTAREIEGHCRTADVTMMVTIDLAIVQEKISQLVSQGVFKRVIVCSFAAALPPAKSLAFRMFKRRDIAKIPPGAPYVRFEALIAGQSAPGPVAIDPAQDIACLQFTGGTTGTPKAAMLSHANITVNVRQFLEFAPHPQGQERILGILPLFHVYAMTVVMNAGVALAAELVLLPRLDMKTLMATIFRCRPTMLFGVPTLYTAISNHMERSSKPLRFINFCMCGGAPLAAETASRFERLSGCEILEGYGLSETSPVVCGNPPGAIRRGSIGKPMPGTRIEIRNQDNPHDVLPQGEKGEICIAGPQVMLGYYKQPAETANAFVDGAFRTGDIGYLDEDGYIFIVDRIKDLIICGGYNVYPRVIEEAAYLHPAVHEAIAIGIPDAYRGQAPKLFVTLHPGATVTAEEIKDFLVGQLNKIEMPKTVEIRATLPKTMVGKLSKKELVAEAAAQSQD
jgi:long-chain acyl-CoA synthetase